MTYLQVSLVALLWLVFAVSSIGKVRSRTAQRAFADSLRQLRLLPERLVPAIAGMVTAAELVVLFGLTAVVAGGFGLVPVAGGVVRSGSLAAAAALLCVLTGGIALALRRGSTARCACFGVVAHPLGGRHLVRNGLLLLAAFGALVTPTGPAVPAGTLLGVLAGGLVALLVMRFDDIIDLFAPTRTTGRVSI